ncbi:hypothetical protein ACTFIV_010698 [Dictyostelium citrinum]
MTLDTACSFSLNAIILDSNLSKSYSYLNILSYVEAHGTGTSTGDPIELELGFSVGNLEAASGGASLVKYCLMFKRQYLTPNINFITPTPAI